MVRNILYALALAGAASPLAAAPLNVRVVDASGHPVRDAVVTLYPVGVAPRPAHGGGRYVVAQQNLQFRPFLTVVPVGADVSFSNLDPTKHHVYSFSPAKKFELKLFATAMLVVSAALSSFIAGAASREVESQLQSSGAVYDRLWQQRSHELQNAAQLLARDFGFRAAVASGDQATIQSALGNAAGRLRVRSAFIVSADGRVSSIGPGVSKAEAAALWTPLDDGHLTGVAVLAGRPRQLVAAPVMAPQLIGWVV